MIDNEDRAGYAYSALVAFASETGQDASGDLEHDVESVISDLVCNLMHLCRRGLDEDKHGKLNFAMIVDRAGSNFEDEVEGETDEGGRSAEAEGHCEFCGDGPCIVCRQGMGAAK